MAALWLAKWKSNALAAEEERPRWRPRRLPESSGPPGQPEVGVEAAAAAAWRLSSGEEAVAAGLGLHCQLSRGLWRPWPGSGGGGPAEEPVLLGG